MVGDEKLLILGYVYQTNPIFKKIKFYRNPDSFTHDVALSIHYQAHLMEHFKKLLGKTLKYKCKK